MQNADVLLSLSYAMRHFFLKSSLTLVIIVRLLYRLVYRLVYRTCLFLYYLRVVSISNFLPALLYRQPVQPRPVHLSVWFPE